MQAFFADIYAEAKRAKPSLGHRALASVAEQGKLQRHYTLNIDGLAQAVGLTTWHPVKNPTGTGILFSTGPIPVGLWTVALPGFLSLGSRVDAFARPPCESVHLCGYVHLNSIVLDSVA